MPSTRLRSALAVRIALSHRTRTDRGGGTEAADIEEQGYRTVTFEDIFNGNELTLKTIARGRGKDRDVQYHGTSSWHAQRAFPELRLPPNPFPIDEREDNPRRKLKNRLMR